MANGQLGEATLVNISSGGCAAANSSEKLNINEPVLIILELSESEKPLELKGKIIRVEEDAFSAEFTGLKPEFIKNFPKMLARELRKEIVEAEKN